MNAHTEHNKILLSIVCSMLITGASYAHRASDKTYFMPRDVGSNLAERHTTWHDMKYANYKDKKHFGARFTANWFYYASTNDKSLGKYFGWFDSTTDTVHDSLTVAASADSPLLPANIIHNAAHGDTASILDTTEFPLNDTIRFRPDQETWGVRLAYYQCLGAITDGLFFHVIAPVAYVRNDLDAKSLGPNTPQTTTDGDSVTVLDYLEGKVEQKVTDPDRQLPMTNALVKDGSSSQTELADLRIELGYNITNKEDYHVGLTAALSIPTGNEPHGKYLFEAISGYSDHWKFGGLLDGHATWHLNDIVAIELHGILNYMYVFDATEKRTLGFKLKNGTPVSFGHWFLGGKAGERELFPLANVLTRDVSVHVGSEFDALGSFTVKWHNVTFDLGYELFYRDSETALVKAWEDNTYAIANTAFDTASTFDPTNPLHAFNNGYAVGETLAIQREDLDGSPASTPSQVIHKIFAGVGHIWQNWDTPFLIGVGGSYEWTAQRTGLEQWGVFLKLGVAV